MSKTTLEALSKAIQDHMQDVEEEDGSLVINWGVVYETMLPDGGFSNGYAVSEHSTPSASLGLAGIFAGSLDNDLLEGDGSDD